MSVSFGNICLQKRSYLKFSEEQTAKILSISTEDYMAIEANKLCPQKPLFDKIVKLYYLTKKDFEPLKTDYDLTQVPKELMSITKKLLKFVEAQDD